MPSEIPTADAVDCPRCLKPPALCVCDGIEPLQTRLSLLILQHPQEQDKTLGTARLTQLHVKDATLTIGLSWPSLAKALGRPADPARWAVLYLGSAKAEALAPDQEVVALDGKAQPVKDQAAALRHLQGVIVLDGTWSQAKALWWRNPWVLKCQRVILGPKTPSRYGKLRYEPRRDSLSTLEAVGLLLSRLEDRSDIETSLTGSFERLLERYRQSHPQPDRPKIDRRARANPRGRKRPPRAVPASQ